MAKYVIRASRFIDGKFVEASPSKPAVIELPDHIKPDAELEPHKGGEPRPSELNKHFAGAATHVMSSPERFSTPSEKPQAQAQGKPKRAADNEPV